MRRHVMRFDVAAPFANDILHLAARRLESIAYRDVYVFVCVML